ncbi:class I SAM-dependent methyltransferase [Kurthia sibirica]|uniref:Class I SAM-dependent methyltransferase n=1 Tax=Kurthia sibirica TaxID=202750 RepID=A0A2U3AQ87_9BACL|nr:class I SAM-dependent methyltransferase [Kurthia sibirica]PWI26720.1 class I SAM-dependent methyltransferase [Kurthia sibirica]GEK32750.1 SAM-dependent methyltransferase [Kurthia sibirica]
MNIQEIVNCMKIYGQDDTIQMQQTAHRFALIDQMQIKEGMTLLEVGCGQGDTLTALAARVGESGHVMGIDPATEAYGEPITLGQAAQHIRKSILGQRITIHFETALHQLADENHFDAIIFSHCLWYFASEDLLRQLIQKAKKMTSIIHIAEWDIVEVSEHQRAHQTAAYIQSYFAQLHESQANIRTLFTAQQITNICQDLDATVEKSIVDASALQDGQWEIDYAQQMNFEGHAGAQQIATMKEAMQFQAMTSTASMNSFVLTAYFT